MFVCLWSPVWRTVADSLADLAPALLTVAPRVVTEERRGGLVWVDARGLDAEQIGRSALDVLRGLGLSNVRVGIGETAIIAELRASTAGDGGRTTGDGERATGYQHLLPATSHSSPVASRQSPAASPESLGSLPISVLEPD